MGKASYPTPRAVLAYPAHRSPRCQQPGRAHSCSRAAAAAPTRLDRCECCARCTCRRAPMYASHTRRTTPTLGQGSSPRHTYQHEPQPSSRLRCPRPRLRVTATSEVLREACRSPRSWRTRRLRPLPRDPHRCSKRCRHPSTVRVVQYPCRTLPFSWGSMPLIGDTIRPVVRPVADLMPGSCPPSYGP